MTSRSDDADNLLRMLAVVRNTLLVNRGSSILTADRSSVKLCSMSASTVDVAMLPFDILGLSLDASATASPALVFSISTSFAIVNVVCSQFSGNLFQMV